MKILLYTKNNKIKEISFKYIVLVFLPIALFFTFSYSIIQQVFFNSASIIQKENKRLKENLANINEKLDVIRKTINDLNNKEKALRIAANINISNDGEFGTGGSEAGSSVFNLINSSNITSLVSSVDNILAQIQFQEENFSIIENKLISNQKMFSRIPGIIPMKGVFAEHGFGNRLHPIYKKWMLHDGIDILGDYGNPILSTAEGKVTFVGYKGGYGLTVEITHGYGYVSLYGHLSKCSVQEGQSIKRFQQIAECGNSGISTGPHLHYEVIYNGEKQDPMNYIFN